MVFNKRVTNDDNILYTPDWVTRMLIENVDLSDKVVWECACGEGHIVTELHLNDINYVGTDIKTKEDFLDYDPYFKFDIIVTNPQFNLKNKFLKRAFELNKPFCFLLPINALESKIRQEMYKNSEMTLDIYMPNKRISFKNSGNSPSFASAWFCFGLREYGENNFQIHFVNAEDYK